MTDETTATDDSIEFETENDATVTVTAAKSDFGSAALTASVENSAVTFTDADARLERAQGTTVLNCGRQKTENGETVEAVIPVGEHKSDIKAIVEAVEKHREQARKERKAKLEAEQRAAIPDEKVAEAKATGERVRFTTQSSDCRDPHEECSTDVRATFVTPEGDIEHGEWTHTY